MAVVATAGSKVPMREIHIVAEVSLVVVIKVIRDNNLVEPIMGSRLTMVIRNSHLVAAITDNHLTTDRRFTVVIMYSIIEVPK